MNKEYTVRVVKDILRNIMLFYKRILYVVACLTTKVDDKTVMFESFQGRSFSCNPKAMYLAMLDNTEFADYTFLWSFRDIEKHSYCNRNERTSIVKYESFAYYKALAKAKYWIFNSNTRAFLKPTDKQVFVQTWHGTPLKRIGCDVCYEGNAVTKVDEILKIYTGEAKKFSYMISPSKYCTDKLISAFRLKDINKEDIVLETGYPRNDSLFRFSQEDIDSYKEKYGIPANKKVILYAPTFRDNKHSQKAGFTIETGMDFEKMKEAVSDEYVILFRAHYFIAERMDFTSYANFVYDVSSVEDVNELYIISDILITDYSSVFFDYANLSRPIIFFMYDYEEYKNQVRDFYIDTRELPGPVISNQEELINEIRKLTSAFEPDDRYIQFQEKYNYLDGADCGIKAVRKIIGGKG